MSDNGETAAQKADREAREHASARRQQHIDALLEERRGYVTHGKTDRVKAVDESLKAAGYSAPAGRKAPKGETA